MKGWCVYIVRCADGTFYTGHTADVDRRVTEHNRGRGARYTRARLPVELVYIEQASDRSMAARREAEIKNLPRRDKERLIEGWHSDGTG